MITTLSAFYTHLQDLRDEKRRIVASLLQGERPTTEQIATLKDFLRQLEEIPKEGEKHVLDADGRKALYTLQYLTSELEKDIIYLEQGKEALIEHFKKIHQGFQEEVSKAASQLKECQFHVLLTDRDGTTNNYSENYNACTQSVYNAVFLHHFASKMQRSIILTSAPLTGLRQNSLLPEDDTIIYAGSKGRAYLHGGSIHRQPLKSKEQVMLDDLKEAVLQLLEREEYSIFSYIGSGFQEKFGQLTVARQDINRSITEEESIAFLQQVKQAVKEVDPEEKYFGIEDTGLDIELLLKTTMDKPFDKGDGIRFITEQLNIPMAGRLTCGDTTSDIALIEASPKTEVVFVTQDEELQSVVRKAAPNAVFVSHPDTLIFLLEQLSEGLS